MEDDVPISPAFGNKTHSASHILSLSNLYRTGDDKAIVQTFSEHGTPNQSPVNSPHEPNHSGRVSSEEEYNLGSSPKSGRISSPSGITIPSSNPSNSIDTIDDDARSNASGIATGTSSPSPSSDSTKTEGERRRITKTNRTNHTNLTKYSNEIVDLSHGRTANHGNVYNMPVHDSSNLIGSKRHNYHHVHQHGNGHKHNHRFAWNKTREFSFDTFNLIGSKVILSYFNRILSDYTSIYNLILLTCYL